MATHAPVGHEKIETNNFLMIVLILVAIAFGGLVEIVRALAENAGELQRIGQGELPETVLTVGIERIVERRLLSEVIGGRAA